MGDERYNPDAQYYAPYQEEMAAWRNQVSAHGVVASDLVELPRHEGIANFMVAHENRVMDARDKNAPIIDAEVRESLELNPVYDPAEHNASAVLEYLRSGLSRNEVRQILASERGGKARKGILKLADELISQAHD